MPGLTGTQLTRVLRQDGMRLPLLLISGYGGALLASRAAAAGVTRVLAKPDQPAVNDTTLAAAVQEAVVRTMGKVAADLSVMADQGTVTLDGWARRPSEEFQARVIASQVPGVKQAHSRVRTWWSDNRY